MGLEPRWATRRKARQRASNARASRASFVVSVPEAYRVPGVGGPVLCIAHFQEQLPQCPSTFRDFFSPSTLPLLALSHAVTLPLVPFSLSPTLSDHWNWILLYQPSQGTFSQANSLTMWCALYHSQISKTTTHVPGAGETHPLLPPHTVSGGGGVLHGSLAYRGFALLPGLGFLKWSGLGPLTYLCPGVSGLVTDL